MVIEAKDDRQWSYKSCKAPVKSSPPTNQHPVFYRLDALPVAQPTMSRHWRETRHYYSNCKKKISWHLPASTASLWYPSGWNEYSSESESESKQSCGLKSLSPWPLSLVNDLVKKSVCLMSSKPLKILKTSIKSPRSLLVSSVVIPSFLVVLHTGALALFLYSSTRSSLLHLL